MEKDDSDLVSVSEVSQDEEPGHDEQPHLVAKPEKADFLGHKETQGVFRAKMMVYLVLITACATASTMVFIFTTRGEKSGFENNVRSNLTIAKLIAQR